MGCQDFYGKYNKFLFIFSLKVSLLLFWSWWDLGRTFYIRSCQLRRLSHATVTSTGCAGSGAGVQHGEPEALRGRLRAVQHRHGHHHEPVRAGRRDGLPQVREGNPSLHYAQPTTTWEVRPSHLLHSRNRVTSYLFCFISMLFWLVTPL